MSSRTDQLLYTFSHIRTVKRRACTRLTDLPTSKETRPKSPIIAATGPKKALKSRCTRCRCLTEGDRCLLGYFLPECMLAAACCAASTINPSAEPYSPQPHNNPGAMATGRISKEVFCSLENSNEAPACLCARTLASESRSSTDVRAPCATSSVEQPQALAPLLETLAITHNPRTFVLWCLCR